MFDISEMSEIFVNDLGEIESIEDARNMMEFVESDFLDGWKEAIPDASDEELEHLKKISTNKDVRGQVTFQNKGSSVVSNYETMTNVLYTVSPWKVLAAELDLSWADTKDYRVIQSEEELDKAIVEMKKASVLVVDTETSGLGIYDLSEDNPKKDHIVGCSITWKKNQGIYIPFRHLKFRNMNLVSTLKKLKPILSKKILSVHNGLFDYRVFYDLGIKLNIKHDTINMLFHINSMVARGGKGLKPNIKKIYGIDTLDLETMTGKARYAGKFETLDIELVQLYGCADTDFGFLLLCYLLPYMTENTNDSWKGKNGLYVTDPWAGYRQDIRLIPILAKMEYYGRPVDMAKLKLFNDVNNQDISRLKRLAYNYVGTFINLRNGIEKVQPHFFNMNSSDELSHILYGVLGIEVQSYSEKTGKPETNSTVFKTLLKIEAEEEDKVLSMLLDGDMESRLVDYIDFDSDDLEGAEESDRYLLKYSKLVDKKFPFIQIMMELRKHIKLQTSFFAPILFDSSEGKYFTSVSLTAAETHRIIDKIQTIPPYLKSVFLPFKENHVLLDADFAQVEARVFTNLSGGMKELKEKLCVPWRDFHRENGAAIFGKKPEDISKAERKSLKTVNFGLPFDMKAKGLVGFQYGVVTDKTLEKKYIAEMEILIDKWKKVNEPIQTMLDWYRDRALEVCQDPKVKEYFEGKKVSKIYNHAGRARVFNLEGVVDDNGNIVDRERASRIRRQAGNFPIQSYARHIYGEAVLSLFDQFERDGLIDIKVKDDSKPFGYKFESLVYLLASIHDEIFCSIDERINQDYVVEMIEKHMMIKPENSCPYFMGISFCYDWREGHSGDVELPVELVWEIINEARETAKKEGSNRIPVFRKPDSDGKYEHPRDIYVRKMKEFDLKKLSEYCEEMSPSIKNGRTNIENFESPYNYDLLGKLGEAKGFNKEEYQTNLELVEDEVSDKTFKQACKFIYHYMWFNKISEVLLYVTDSKYVKLSVR